MLVKKFEAKSIKDAISLVKFHMGPDAIILSAKENVKRFGLMGEASVEVTAAVSENKLQSKKLAERKLNSQDREKFKKISAKQQRAFIKKATQEELVRRAFNNDVGREHELDLDEESADNSDVAGYAAGDDRDELTSNRNESPGDREDSPPAMPPIPRQNGITSVRYAEIDVPAPIMTASALTATAAGQTAYSPHTAVRNGSKPSATPTPPVHIVPGQKTTPTQVMPTAPIAASATVTASPSLQQEVQYLRGLIANFQKVPSGFVSLHPGAEDGLPYELSFAFKRMADAGISHDTIVEILKIANERLPKEQKKKKAFIDGWVIRYLLEDLQVVENPVQAKFHVFLGPTGQGKTSTVVKLACHLIMKEKKRVGLITGDIVKVGASDQFKIYAQILNAPYAVVTKPEDWKTLAPQLAQLDYVLFDTPGMNLKAASDLEVLRKIMPPALNSCQMHFVQSILARDADAFEIAERFKLIGFQDVIFTRLDEAVQFGFVYNFQKHFRSPLHSFGIGSNIPEDFEFASKERVIDLLFKLSQFRERDQS